MNFLRAIAFSAVLFFQITGAVTAGSQHSVEEQPLALTLERARVLALENNRDILISRHEAAASLGAAVAEKGAFDPVFDITSSYSKTSEPSASALSSGGLQTRRAEASMGFSGTTALGTYYDLFRLSVSKESGNSPVQSLSPAFSSRLDMKVGQDILKNFGSKSARAPLIKQTLRSELARLALTDEVSRVLFEVERKYWNLAAARHRHKLAQQNLELGIDLLERNLIKVKEGVLPEIDEIKARSEVAARRVDLIEAESDFRKAGDGLKNLLGLPLGTALEPSDFPAADFRPPLDVARLIETAFRNRGELKRALKQTEIAEAERDFRSNQLLPKLAVEGTVSLRGLAGSPNPDALQFGDVSDISADFSGGFSDALSTAADGDFVSWGASVTMSLPIGNRRAEGLYQTAQAEVAKSVAQYRKVKELAALEVKEAIDKVRSGYRRVEAAEVAVSLAGEALEAEKEKYAAGLSTTREVLEAQRDFAGAQSKRIESLADYKTALAALARATGTIIETSGIEIPKEF